ncbi:hypothetical protein SUGI_0254010 [Cryptomeria japonica]|nr:hypothetical protein SUGI_0254010 [Cryptomeria japonica]
MKKIHMKVWVQLFFFLLVGLKVCSAARLVAEKKEVAAETKPWIASGNNQPEFRFRENVSPGLKVQGLATLEPVGHMEVSRGAMKPMHKERILGSSPSPGGGN